MKNLLPSRLRGMFSEKDAQSEGLQGLFSKFDAHSEGLQGMFGKKTYFQRLFWGRLFPKSPFRALFLGGFSPNHPFARCFWEVFLQKQHSHVLGNAVFVEGGVACRSFGWGKAARLTAGLSFLRCFFECFAFQLLGHVTRLHVHIVDVLFAIVAARGTFAAQHQRVVA